MSLLKRLGILVSGNRLVQRRLAKRVRFCQDLMGIGSGDRPEASGERRLFHEIRRRSPGPWCVMDVGANCGQFLRLALRSMPASGSDHAGKRIESLAVTLRIDRVAVAPETEMLEHMQAAQRVGAAVQ